MTQSRSDGEVATQKWQPPPRNFPTEPPGTLKTVQQLSDFSKMIDVFFGPWVKTIRLLADLLDVFSAIQRSDLPPLMAPAAYNPLSVTN